jgi:hypothetical protein
MVVVSPKGMGGRGSVSGWCGMTFIPGQWKQVPGPLSSGPCCRSSAIFHLSQFSVAARLLKPLGNPPAHYVKFFAASELLEQVEDRAWLAKVTNALNQRWQGKNAAKKICSPSNSQNGHAALPMVAGG